jgi:hypothetical protein
VRETFEVLFLEGAPYRELIAENEKPLAAAKHRTYWIDPEEKAIVKEETEFLVAVNGVQPGTVLAIVDSSVVFRRRKVRLQLRQ